MSAAVRHYTSSFHFEPAGRCYCGSGKTFGDCCADKRHPELPEKLFIKENFVPPEMCREFIRLAETHEKNWLSVIDTRNKQGQREDRWHRTRVTQKVELGELQRYAADWFSGAAKAFFKGQAEWIETPQLLFYEKGGRYNLHADAEQYCQNTHQFYRFIDRDFSMLIYLNDGYDGGELFFKGLNYTYTPKCGDLVIFPSNHVFSHASLPMNSGEKWALVSWGAVKGSARVGRPRSTIAL